MARGGDKPKSPLAPVALTAMQVDVTTRMGALTPATPTGFKPLDRMLIGGLRTGTLVSISGDPGVGKSSFVLLLAYMAARAKAGTLFASVTLDETEIMSRLAARALHREYPDSRTSYGAIWSGEAWQDEVLRGPVRTSLDIAVQKVGQRLHLHRAQPFESTAELAESVSYLWKRHDRVVMVVDGIEAFAANVGGNTPRTAAANASFDSRVAQVAYELRQLADEGCAVVVTVQRRNADLVAPAATLAAELREMPVDTPPLSERDLALGARPVELSVTKNRLGPTGIVPLRFIAGASVFEEDAT